MKSRSRLIVALAAFSVGAVITAGTVYAITIEVPARGTFVSSHDKTELLRGIARLHGQPTDATVQRIQMNPGEGSNWHTHAGPVTVVIKSGSFTVVQSDCSQTTYTAGQVSSTRASATCIAPTTPGRARPRSGRSTSSRRTRA
jgi:hypothetical protein